MATEARPRASGWSSATVLEACDETPCLRSVVLECRAWPGHLAGQRVDVRLPMLDGTRRECTVSLASAPEDEHLLLTMAGVSGVLEPADELDVRGPVGRTFVWEHTDGGPLLLVAAGAGIAPFRSMLRHRAAARSTAPTRLLYSSRSPAEVAYADELARFAAYDEVDVRLTLTRTCPEGWRGYRRRIDRDLVREVSWPPGERPHVFVCGPASFVESAAAFLVALGHDAARVRTRHL